MGSRSFRYFLVWKEFEILLFKSQFYLRNEAQCLRHYEKGIERKIFEFDRARINRIWSELSLWGLVGRTCPVELVRILCAFGCEIRLVRDGEVLSTLQKSFWPVTYFIPVAQAVQPFIRHMYHLPLEPNSTEHIPILLELDQRVVVGSFYFTSEADVDFQLPRLCRLMEYDLCLPVDCIRRALSALFSDGHKVVAESEEGCVVLAYRDRLNGILHGFNADQSLFYIGNLIGAA